MTGMESERVTKGHAAGNIRISMHNWRKVCAQRLVKRPGQGCQKLSMFRALSHKPLTRFIPSRCSEVSLNYPYVCTDTPKPYATFGGGGKQTTIIPILTSLNSR